MSLVKVDNTVFDSLHKKSIENNIALKHKGIDKQEIEALASKIDDDKILKFVDPNTGAEEEYISRNGDVWKEFY